MESLMLCKHLNTKNKMVLSACRSRGEYWIVKHYPLCCSDCGCIIREPVQEKFFNVLECWKIVEERLCTTSK